MELWMRRAGAILVMTPLVAAVSIDPHMIPNFAVWSLAAGLPLLVQVARHHRLALVNRLPLKTDWMLHLRTFWCLLRMDVYTLVLWITV